MRVLGLDIGERRVGVAVSDPGARVSTPVAVVDARDLDRIGELVAEYDARLVVVGLPLSLDGSEGPQARSVREVAGRLERVLPVPLRYWDERFSSTEARRAMASAGDGSKRARGKVDMVAASIVLQSFLDAEASVGDDG